MFVYPVAPLVEVVRTTLLRDTLERSDANAVVKRNGDRASFPGFGMCVLQNHMVPPRPVVSVAERPKHADDLLAGEIA
jgi:hypothetical protein